MRQRTLLFLMAPAALAASFYVALSSSLGNDYPGPTCQGCDYAGPPIDALVHGHLSAFFATQPFMGSVTLLLRAPFVGIVGAAGGDQLWQYRLGALPCLLIAAGLAWWVAGTMRRQGQGVPARFAVLGLITLGPMTFKALQWGHPEELVGASLAVAAVLAAGRGRPTIAGVMLGLAVATKQWALLAVLPVMVAAGERRTRALAVAAPVAGILILPMLLGDPARFTAQNLHAGVVGAGVTQTNLWWIFHVQTGVDSSSGAGLYAIPAWLGRVTHPLVLGLSLGLSVLFWRRSPQRRPDDALALLALLFLLRCLLDPLTISYHHLPFVIALAVFEGLRRRGLPVVSLASAAALWFIAQVVAPAGHPDTLNLAYLAWALPTVAYLGVLCFSSRVSLSAGRAGLEPARAA